MPTTGTLCICPSRYAQSLCNIGAPCGATPVAAVLVTLRRMESVKFESVNGVYDSVSPVPACIQRDLISTAQPTARRHCRPLEHPATRPQICTGIISWLSPEPQTHRLQLKQDRTIIGEGDISNTAECCVDHLLHQGTASAQLQKT